MVYAVVCGLAWIISGIVSIATCESFHGSLKGIRFGLFFFSYIMFAGLFGAIMIKIKEHTFRYNNQPCSEIESKFRRSGDEFMGYSICSFITIGISVIMEFFALID